MVISVDFDEEFPSSVPRLFERVRFTAACRDSFAVSEGRTEIGVVGSSSRRCLSPEGTTIVMLRKSRATSSSSFSAAVEVGGGFIALLLVSLSLRPVGTRLGRVVSRAGRVLLSSLSLSRARKSKCGERASERGQEVRKL